MRRLRAFALVTVLTLTACQTRTVTVTPEVTREVQMEPTPLVTQQMSEEMPATTLSPYPDAPLCPDSGELHDTGLFHTLWDSTRGCHYDHEHGQNPFTPELAATFPEFDLRGLLGSVGVGHTNPSSPMENTHKHGGFKWQITIPHPNSCAGHEGSTIGVDASVIQYHAFGDYSIEFQSRVHSVVALMRACRRDTFVSGSNLERSISGKIFECGSVRPRRLLSFCKMKDASSSVVPVTTSFAVGRTA